MASISISEYKIIKIKKKKLVGLLQGYKLSVAVLTLLESHLMRAMHKERVGNL